MKSGYWSDTLPTGIKFKNGAELHQYLVKGFKALDVEFNAPGLLAQTIPYHILPVDFEDALQEESLCVDSVLGDPDFQYAPVSADMRNLKEALRKLGLPAEDAGIYACRYPELTPDQIYQKWSSDVTDEFFRPDADEGTYL